MEELLEEVESRSICEDAMSDPLAVGITVITEDLLAEPLDESLPDVWIVREQVVDDLVARHGCCAVMAKALERRGLSGADPTGDRNRERATQREGLVGVGLLGDDLEGRLL